MLLYALALVMALQTGSVPSAKLRRAQDRMAAFDDRIQKKKAVLEAMARRSAVASTAPALVGTGRGPELGEGR